MAIAEINGSGIVVDYQKLLLLSEMRDLICQLHDLAVKGIDFHARSVCLRVRFLPFLFHSTKDLILGCDKLCGY